jgi:hypothetical protein
MKEPLRISILFPLLAVAIIIVFAGGLGITFMFLESLHWQVADVPLGVVGLGMALVVGVPTVAGLLQMRVERDETRN